MSTRGTQTSVLWLLASRICARVIAASLQAVVFVVLARRLQPAKFGDFVQAFGLCAFALVLTGGGLGTLALRTGSRPNAARSAVSILRLGTAVGVLTVTALACIYSGLNRLDSLTVGAFLLALSEASNELYVSTLSGQGRLHLASLLVVLRRCILIVPLLALGHSSIPSLLGVAACLSLSLPVTVSLRTLRRPLLGLALFREGRAYWQASLAAQLSGMDTTVLRICSDATVTGLYGAATRAAAPVTLVATSLVGVMVPMMSNVNGKPVEARVITRIGWAAGSLICLSAPGVALIAVRVLGASYANSYWVVTAAIMAGGLSCVSQSYQAVHFAAGSALRAAWAVGVGSLVGLGVLAFSVRLWGILGSSLGLVAMQGAILILFLTAFRTTDKWHPVCDDILSSEPLTSAISKETE